MRGSGVQFRGIPEVLKAYDNIKIVNWAVKYDKDLNMKYEGSGDSESRGMLQDYLDMLKGSRSESQYKLCFYDDLPKGGKIKPSTEPSFSFNFTIFNDESYPSERQAGYSAIMEKLNALETKFALLKEEEEEPERETGIMGFLSGIVEDPQVKSQLVSGLIGLFKKSPVIPMESRPPQALGKIGAVETEPQSVLDESQTLKLQAAIGILATVDPHLGDNLLKIAQVARTDKDKYGNLISLLNTLL
jgi:hypothetical protein